MRLLFKKDGGARLAPAVFFAGALLALALQSFLLPEGPIWITDNGCKEILLRNFAETGSFALENPAQELDPEGEFFPGGFHFRRNGEKFQAIYPEFFSLLSYPVWLLAGRAGLLFMPALGLFAALAGFLHLLKALRCPNRCALCLGGALVLCTPLLFYAGTFWETTLAAALIVWAVDARLRGKALASGLLFGMAIFLREEGYLAALCFGASLLLFDPKSWRSHFRFALGAAIPVLALWIYNLHAYGHALGFHGSAYESGFRNLSEAYFLYWLQFDAWTPDRLWHLRILLIPIALLPIAGLFKGQRGAKTALLAACLASWSILYFQLIRNPDLVRNAGWNIGLLSSCPLFAGTFLCARESLTEGTRVSRALSLAVLSYCVLLPPILTQSDIGVIWGPRHFLPVAPLLLWSGLQGFRRIGLFHGWKRALLFGACLCALLHTAAGEKALFTQARDAERASRGLEAGTSDIVLTDVFFLPEMTPELWGKRRFLYVRGDEFLPKALDALRRSGATRFDIVLSPESQFGTLSPSALRWMDEVLAPDGDVVRLRATPNSFMNFDIYPTRFRE